MLAFACLVATSGGLFAQTGDESIPDEVPVPALAGQRVHDQTGTLSASEIDQLEEQLRQYETEHGSQLVVLIVPTTGLESIEQFSIRVAEAWQIGRAGVDDGIILLIAKDDRQVRIEVGYGLEGALPDATAKRIISDFIVPAFR